MTVAIDVSAIGKSFVLHAQGGIKLPVLHDLDLRVAFGECVVLDGPSGAGKSTLLRALYANYRVDGGRIRVRHDDEMVDLVTASEQTLIDIRRRSLGYVSQFLRVIPRVSTLDVVAEPLLALGLARDRARDRAAHLLSALDLPTRLWDLAPATFSGGEQQRVNIARGLIAEHRILLLDEPTASLDAENRDRVVALIEKARSRGTAIVGIFHDRPVRDRVATRLFRVERQEMAA
jgi:alpha-D-ribose 1-methylphosphonate 5-triphosphate synthase subunit PhnL